MKKVLLSLQGAHTERPMIALHEPTAARPGTWHAPARPAGGSRRAIACAKGERSRLHGAPRGFAMGGSSSLASHIGQSLPGRVALRWHSETGASTEVSNLVALVCALGKEFYDGMGPRSVVSSRMCLEKDLTKTTFILPVSCRSSVGRPTIHCRLLREKEPGMYGLYVDSN